MTSGEQPSWASAEAWLVAAAACISEGKRPTVAVICPDCVHPVRRVDEERYELGVGFCRCTNEMSTASGEYQLHGIPDVATMNERLYLTTDLAVVE